MNKHVSPSTHRPSVIHLEGGYEIGTCAQEFNSATKNFALWKPTPSALMVTKKNFQN